MTVSAQELRDRIAYHVRQRREALGLTQEGFAYRANIATRHLQKIESAQVNLTLDTIAKLAAAAQVDPSRLVSSVNNTLH